MATTAISSADMTTLRDSVHNIDDVSLYVTPLVQVAQATITGVPSSQPFVDVSVSWSTAFDDVKTGQLVVITDGSDNVVTRAVVRKVPIVNTLYLSATPLGSAGYATMQEVAIAVDHTATVYTHRPLWGLYSRIDEAAQVFYKEWDKAYTDENSQPPPVANTGAWQSAKVSSGGTARFTLPRGGVNDSFALGAATISSYSWSLPTGVSLVAGYAATDAVIEVDADAGTHQVSLTVTDSNSKAHTAYLWLFVSDNSTEKALTETYPVVIDSDSQDRRGREVVFTINVPAWDGNVTELYPGAGVLMKFDTSFDGVSLTDGVIVDTFIGYVTDVASNHDGNRGTVTVTAKSPMLIADDIPQPEQSLEEVASPASWVECTSALSNLRGAAYYLIKWHTPALLDMHDLPSGINSTLRRQFIDLDTQSLGAALSKVVSLFFPEGIVGSLSDGTTQIKQHLSMESNATRNSAAVVMTATENDIQPPLTIIRRFYGGVREVRGGAFSYNGTDLTGKYAQKKWYQGVASITVPDFTAVAGSEVARTIEVIGHAAALKNASIQDVGFDFVGYRDVIEPAAMQWMAVNVSADYVPYSTIPANWRTLPLSVDRDWSFDPERGIDMTVTVFTQPETFGQVGEEYTVPNVIDDNLTGFDGQPFVPYYDAAYDLAGGVGTVATDFYADLEKFAANYVLDFRKNGEIAAEGGGTGTGDFTDADEDGLDDDTGLTEEQFTPATEFGKKLQLAGEWQDAIVDIDTYYDLVAGEADPAAELSDYIQTAYDVTSAANADAFAANVHANLGIDRTNWDAYSELLALAGDLYCSNDTIRTALINHITFKKSFTLAVLKRHNLLVATLSDAQFTQWESSAAPSTDYVSSACYLWPEQTLTIPTTGTALLNSEAATDWTARSGQSQVRITVSGQITGSGGDILTPFYSYDAVLDTWTYNPIEVGKGNNSSVKEPFNFSTPNRGTTVITGVYETAPGTVNSRDDAYYVLDQRTFANDTRDGTASGSITVKIKDLGEV